MPVVKVEDLGGTVTDYECREDDKVLDLKVQVAGDCSQPTSRIKLLHGAELLKNDMLVATLERNGPVRVQMLKDYERITAGSLDHLSSSAVSWNEAAEKVVDLMKRDGLQQGQVLWIDIHNKNMRAESVACAYFSRDIVGRGPLNIQYLGAAGHSWKELYTWADEIAVGKEVISISGASSNTSASSSTSTDNTKYLCIFYYEGETVPAAPVEHATWASGSWNGAATGLLMALHEKGVQRGQLLGIDAHNDSPDAAATFTAHFSRGLQGYGRLALTCNCSANEIADWAAVHDRVARENSGREVVSLTSSSNCEGRSVTFGFWHVPIDPLEICIVESAPGTWNAAAENLADKLAELQVERNQIVTIDAQNRGFNQPCVLSAHYHPAASKSGGGPLQLAWKLQESNHQNWDYLCGWAHGWAEGKDVISFSAASGTLANNTNGRSLIIFYNSSDAESPTNEMPGVARSVEYICSSEGSWNGAAGSMVAALTRAGVERGHIINISACNLNPNASAEFQCHFDRARPGGGQPGQVSYSSLNVQASFDAMHHQAGVDGAGKDVISITGSSNENGRSVVYVFYWKATSDA